MPTKQELMDMMANPLPGEPVTVNDSEISSSSSPPPTYPDLEKASFCEQQRKPHEPPTTAPQQVYIIAQPTTLPNHQRVPTQFGTRSHLCYCPSCHATQMTRCEHESNMMTHIIAAILCFTTCCCCLPYLFDNCKTARHYCQNCGAYLGAQDK